MTDPPPDTTGSMLWAGTPFVPCSGGAGPAVGGSAALRERDGISRPSPLQTGRARGGRATLAEGEERARVDLGTPLRVRRMHEGQRAARNVVRVRSAVTAVRSPELERRETLDLQAVPQRDLSSGSWPSDQ
ncbi:hypothetical protein VTN02DRAFT_2973 [Thermoascus thermophilus]